MTREPVKKRIIGIDPGYAITGYGIIDKTGSKRGAFLYRFNKNAYKEDSNFKL